MLDHNRSPSMQQPRPGNPARFINSYVSKLTPKPQNSGLDLLWHKQA